MVKISQLERTQTSKVSDFGELARRRSRAYRTLSAVFAAPPDGALLDTVRQWSTLEAELAPGSLPTIMRRGLKKIGAWLEEEDSQLSPHRLSSLKSEFVRLFRGLRRELSPPPPYESVYVDNGFLYGCSTDQVKRKYQQFNLGGATNEPPDHLALELDFMRFLCEKEAEAWQSGQEVWEWLEEQYEFLREHLLLWVPAFCSNIRECCDTPFYSGVADLTEGWICCDQEVIKGVMDAGKQSRQARAST
ncbi:MAG: molecular chaperone TorD family protein, partial [Dehalococcoidia bacterium]